MARRANDGGRVRSDRNPSIGAAVLDRPAGSAPGTETKNLLQEEILRIVFALQQGRLAERARADLFQGGDRTIVEGLNGMLDAVIKPLNVSAEYVDRISKGDIPPKITDTYNGDFNEIKNNLNVCIDSISRMVGDGLTLKQAMLEGKLAVRSDAARHEGDFRKVIEGFNLALDNVIKPLNVSAEYVDRISKGDIPPKITDTYTGDFNEIKNNLNVCIDSISRMVGDGLTLTQAMLEGKLAVRSDAARHEGDFRKVIEGFNLALDNVIKPLNVSAEYVDRISKGDIPPKITDTYTGDFNEIKNNLNACIDGLGGLVEANAVLQRMAVNDYTKTVEGSYSGIFADVASAVNGTQQRVQHVVGTVKKVAQGDLGDLADYKRMGRRSEHDELVPSLTLLMENLQALMADTNALVKASLEGKLDPRADASKHQGDYRKIVAGVNEMLDAVLLPIGEGNRILALIRGGNLREKVEIACKGDHEKMKNAVNGVHAWLIDLVTYVTKIANGDLTASVAKASDQDQIHEWLVLLKNNINALAVDAASLAKAAADGRVGTRADATKHQGDYRKIIEGVNNTLDSIVEPDRKS